MRRRISDKHVVRRFLKMVALHRMRTGDTDESATVNAERAETIRALSELIEATNDDFAHSRVELFFFLGAILFVLVTTLSIEDRDFLIGGRVKLPILDLGLSFEAFLLGAPVLLVAVHLAILLKFDRLRAKSEGILEEIRACRVFDAKSADRLELEIASNFVTQSLVTNMATHFHRVLHRLIYFICLYFMPLSALAILNRIKRSPGFAGVAVKV
jgi:hypothetical protein